MNEMNTYVSFIARIRTNITDLSKRRDTKRSNAIDVIILDIQRYISERDLDYTTLEIAKNKLHCQLAMTDHGTVAHLQEKVQALEAEIERLMVQKMKTERFFEKQEAEMATLRKKAGIKLPTFLEDTELT